MAALGLRFCARAFSSCGKRGPLFITVCGPLTIAASLVVEHRLQMRRLSSCGSRAQLLLGMWDLHRPGLEPTSHALADRLSTTAPPGKPNPWFLIHCTYDAGHLHAFLQIWYHLYAHVQLKSFFWTLDQYMPLLSEHINYLSHKHIKLCVPNLTLLSATDPASFFF